ncbi:MAG: hypothetical protein GX246_09980 [Clostridiales bacterium]|nr:hypothetical protein [Clostridiales bacterium]
MNKKGKPVRDLVRNEAEAAIKAQLYHLIVDEGFGGNHIVNWLNERGIKAKRGTALWRATSLWAMIGIPLTEVKCTWKRRYPIRLTSCGLSTLTVFIRRLKS